MKQCYTMLYFDWDTFPNIKSRTLYFKNFYDVNNFCYRVDPMLRSCGWNQEKVKHIGKRLKRTNRFLDLIKPEIDKMMISDGYKNLNLKERKKSESANEI